MAKRGWRGIANSKDKRNTSLTEGADRVSRGHRSCWADRVVKSGQLQIVVAVEVRVVEGIDLQAPHLFPSLKMPSRHIRKKSIC